MSAEVCPICSDRPGWVIRSDGRRACSGCGSLVSKVPAARPVKVWDIIRCTGPKSLAGDRTVLGIEGPTQHALMLIRTPLADFEVSEATLRGGLLVHASDGAPIDVPATLAALARDRANTPKTPTDSMDGRPLAIGGPMPYSEKLAASEALDKAAKRIAELEAQIADPAFRDQAQKLSYFEGRASYLSDQCGELRSDLHNANATVGRQAREIERLQRVIRGKR